MQTARRLIVALSYSIVVWVFASVAGALLDPAHAAFWSASLMWSFLSTLLVAPALVMIYDASSHASQERRTAAARAPVPMPADESTSAREADATPRSAPTTASTARRPSASSVQRPTPNTSHRSFIEEASAAYPVSEEFGTRPEDENENRPEWAGAYAV